MSDNVKPLQKKEETEFEKTIRENAENKKRVEEERKNHNEGVIRSHRLKK